MDPASLTALAALAGSLIGGLTSLVASWLSQHVQFRAERFAQDLSRRQELYKNFVEEATRLYAHAYGHDQAEVSELVTLYALGSRMRVLSSPAIVESADQVVQLIIETYLAPNKTFSDIGEVIEKEALNPLRAFSNACREEMRGREAFRAGLR
jgi:hypothetical protein